MHNIETLTPLVEQLPSGVKEKAATLIAEMGTVIEGIGDEPVVWKPPYLRLVQGTTDRGSIPKGTAIGDFVMGEEKVEQPFHFIPLRMWDSRQMWDPDQNNAKLLCWSPDARLGSVYGDCRTCAHKDWIEGQGSACGKVKNLIAITSDLSRVFTISFAKSNFKIGNELHAALQKAAVQPYARTYGLGSATNSTAKNVENFKLEILDATKRRTPEEYIPFLAQLFELIKVDRKFILDSFYENAQRRAAQQLAHTPAPATPAIENATVVEAAVEVDKAAVSPTAMKYSV